MQTMRVKASRKRLLVCLACGGEGRIRLPFGEPRGMDAIRIGKEHHQGYCWRTSLQYAFDFIGKERISRDDEVWLYFIQQVSKLSAHQARENLVRQHRSPGCIEKVELRRPQ